MPQISQLAATYASQVFWLLITFGILYLGIGKLMVPKIMSTVDARGDRITADLRAAEQARAEADRTEERWRTEMDAARNAAMAETAKAKAEVSRLVEAQLRAADADLAERTAHHDLAIANAKAEAMVNLRTVAAEAAQDMVAKLSGVPVDIDRAAQAVRSAIAHG